MPAGIRILACQVGWRFAVDDGFDEGAPVGEDQVAGQDEQILKESFACTECLAGLLPKLVSQVANGVKGEGQKVHGGQQGGQILLAMAKIMLEVIAAILYRVELLVLDFPARPTRRRKLDDIVLVYVDIGDKTVAVRDENCCHVFTSIGVTAPTRYCADSEL